MERKWGGEGEKADIIHVRGHIISDESLMP